MNIENINLTEELILKAGACKTSEELMALALENGVTITPEQLPELMAEVAKKCSGEVSDDALEMASAVGGKITYTDSNGRKCKIVTRGHSCKNFVCANCGSSKYMNGDKHNGNCRNLTTTCSGCHHHETKNLLDICTCDH